MTVPSPTMQSRILPLKEWLSAHRDASTDADGIQTMDSAEDAVEVERIRIYEAAWTEGYESGMSEAKAQIETRAESAERQWKTKYADEVERLSALSARLKALESPLTGAVAELEKRIESMVVETVYAAVVRIVASAARERQAIVDVCREALADYPLRPVVLRVSRADLEAVESVFREADIRIEGDIGLSTGQCRLESGKGLYEAGIEQRLEALMRAFVDCVNAGSAVA